MIRYKKRLAKGSPLQPDEYFFVYTVCRVTPLSQALLKATVQSNITQWSHLLPGHWHREKRPGTRNRAVSYSRTPSPGKDHCLESNITSPRDLKGCLTQSVPTLDIVMMQRELIYYEVNIGN